MNRRHLLTVSGAAVAGSLISQSGTQAKTATTTVLGLDLPPLDYAPAALEPHIDAMTMSIHHDKHHAAYVTKLADALKAAKVKSTDPVEIIKNIPALPAEQQTAIRNNGGGHVNHSWFWSWMAPSGTGAKGPEGKLGEAIQNSFSSIDVFKKTFSEAATKRFGSGWAWLIVASDGKLEVTSTPNQDNPLMKGIVADKELGTPILGIDVWEHAYYLKYQNKRPDYIAAWWNVVNWAEVAKYYDDAKA